MIEVHPHATADLRKIRTESPWGFSQLVALIEQLKADPGLADKLLDHGYGDDRSEEISVEKWLSIYNKVERLPVWRLKSWTLLQYRLIYLYYYRDKSFHILAIVPKKELNYDDLDDPLRKRIIATIRAEFPGA